MAVEPIKKDVDGDDGNGDPTFDGSLLDLVYGGGTTVPDDQVPNEDDGELEAMGGEDTCVTEEVGDYLLGGGALAREVEAVLHSHYGNLSQIRSVLSGLATQGRTEYEIFRRLPSEAVTQPYLLDLIAKIGGKNFGDLMLEVFYGENKEEVAAIREESGFAEISTNRAFYVDTEVSREMETISFDLIDDFKKIITKRSGNSPVSYFNPDPSLFRQYLMDRVINCPQYLQLADDVYAKLMAWDPNFNQGKYRLRGSMVFEDWLDPQVAGVSPSGVYDGRVPKDAVDRVFLRNCDNDSSKVKLANGDPDLWKFRLNFLLPYIEFFFHKEMSKLAERRDDLEGDNRRISGYARYHLEPEEQLGIQVAPEIDVEKHVVAVIDEENVVRMDLNLKSLGDKDLSIRVMVDGSDNITVRYGFTPEENRDAEVGFVDDDELERPAYLSKEQILGVAKLMRLKRNFYGFDVDGEFCLDKGGHLVDVQTRVAPDVVEMQSDQELDLRGYTKVSESCFGLGQKFAVKGKLLVLKDSINGLFSNKLDELVKQFGDLSKYILLSNNPLAASLFGLQRLAFEKGTVPAGVIDMSRGVALTHTPVQSGASNFLRNNIAVMGTGDNTDALFDLIEGDVFAKSAMSKVEVIMICRDGKTVEVYAPNEVAKDLIREIN
jgi:hypothetical protein